MNDIKPATDYLKNHCLAELPLKFDEVAELYYNAKLDGARWTQRLCMSHERQRAEISGLEIRVAELEKELKQKTVIHNEDGSFWCPSCGHDSRNVD